MSPPSCANISSTDLHARPLSRSNPSVWVTVRPRDLATLREIQAYPRVAAIVETEFPNVQRVDREGFFGRVRSSSYVHQGLERRETFDRCLEELFDRHQRDGWIDIDYRTVVYAWKLA